MVERCPERFSVTPSSCLPSGENSQRLILVLNSQVWRSLPVCTCHSLMVLSAPPVASSSEDGFTSTVHSAPWCPWYVPIRSPLCEYQAQTTWSYKNQLPHIRKLGEARTFDTEKMMSPSALYCLLSVFSLPFRYALRMRTLTCVSARSCPERRMGLMFAMCMWRWGGVTAYMWRAASRNSGDSCAYRRSAGEVGCLALTD